VSLAIIRRIDLKSKVNLLGIFLPLVLFGLIMIMSSWRTPMWMDEYVFYKLSSNLPSYSTSSNWFYEDRPELLNPSVTWEDKSSVIFDKKATFQWIYDNDIYPHTPLAPILVWPLVKTLNIMADNEIIPHIEEQEGYPSISKNITDKELTDILKTRHAETITKILRIVPILLFVLAMFLAYKVMNKRVGNKAFFFAVPIAAGMQLLIGAGLFYWDVFMLFFFMLTWYLMETNHPKWAFLSACCMVNTKMFIGLLFLIPLIVKNRKMFFAAFSLIPYYIVTICVTGDPFFLITHYGTGGGMASHNYVYTLYDFNGYMALFISLGIPFFLAMTVPLFWRIKKYPEYIALWICGMIYAWGCGMGITHLSCLLYVGVLIFPLVVKEFGLYDKLSKLINKFSPKEEVDEKIN